MDRDNASFQRSVDSLQESLAREIVPVQLPIGEEKEFQGVIDLITNKAYYYDLDGKGKPVTKDIPADMVALIDAKQAEILAGSFTVFQGPLIDQAGTERYGAAVAMTDMEILSMDWHVAGVTTPLPS
jgi:translation elongation factor EF-G